MTNPKYSKEIMVDPEVRIFFSNFPLKSVYTSYAPSMMSQGKTPWKDPVLGVFPASVGAIHLERPPQINVNLQVSTEAGKNPGGLSKWSFLGTSLTEPAEKMLKKV